MVAKCTDSVGSSNIGSMSAEQGFAKGCEIWLYVDYTVSLAEKYLRLCNAKFGSI